MSRQMFFWFFKNKAQHQLQFGENQYVDTTLGSKVIKFTTPSDQKE
jgi:hypothetical protein